MRIFRHHYGVPADFRGGVVAIGNFDGVHRGHRAVIGLAAAIAKDSGAPWGVLTFEPHPREFFAPDIEPFRLTPFHIKARLIEDLGADFMVVMRFDKALCEQSAEDFVDQVLVGSLAAKHVVSGHEFVFGHQRKGDSAFLNAMGAERGFGTSAVEEVLDENGTIISSTRIRSSLRDGKPREAAALLGRPFDINGRVITGEARGRTIGFPTANLKLTTHICPAIGVYAVRAGIGHGRNTVWHDGVANLGYRPTFGGTTISLETNIFDFSGDLVGKHLRVALVDYLRAEKKFSGIEELTAQIQKDSAQARRILTA
ncbi:MAG: bifunctional riboflavin kinase/FAD synthetase [Proteobacteria bacterium]|nr:bifunctional riboflavin kinase/FAD synthetase [Pseudomonadota bacterium]